MGTKTAHGYRQAVDAGDCQMFPGLLRATR
ncbi:hypothetical protein ABIA33_003747 [Streptacidiphilus sp. MAP12-16]